MGLRHRAADLGPAASAPDEPAELDRQVAERVPALRDWIRTFDTGAHLRSAGLSGPELGTLRALLRPLSGPGW